MKYVNKRWGEDEEMALQCPDDDSFEPDSGFSK